MKNSPLKPEQKRKLHIGPFEFKDSLGTLDSIKYSDNTKKKLIEIIKEHDLGELNQIELIRKTGPYFGLTWHYLKSKDKEIEIRYENNERVYECWKDCGLVIGKVKSNAETARYGSGDIYHYCPECGNAKLIYESPRLITKPNFNLNY